MTGIPPYSSAQVIVRGERGTLIDFPEYELVCLELLGRTFWVSRSYLQHPEMGPWLIDLLDVDSTGARKAPTHEEMT